MILYFLKNKFSFSTILFLNILSFFFSYNLNSSLFASSSELEQEILGKANKAFEYLIEEEDKVFPLLKDAAEQQHIYSQATYADLLLKQKNYKEAAKWYLKALDGGHEGVYEFLDSISSKTLKEEPDLQGRLQTLTQDLLKYDQKMCQENSLSTLTEESLKEQKKEKKHLIYTTTK